MVVYIFNAHVINGAQVRHFGKLIYLMPAFVINTKKLKTLTNAVVHVMSECRKHQILEK